MSRFLGIAGIAALLLAATGCTLDSFLAPNGPTPGPKEVVVGSPEMVSAKLQDGLTAAGIAVLTERDRGEIRMAGQTTNGKAFCVHLHGKKVAGADKTLVHLYWWGRDTDQEFWQLLVDLLGTPSVEASE